MTGRGRHRRRVSLSVEQCAEIETWLQDGETLAAFLAAAIQNEVAWRRQVAGPRGDTASLSRS